MTHSISLVSARWGRIGLLLVLVLAFGLRLWDINAPSVWHDEGWSIRAIRDPINTPDDNTPPVYYAIMHVLWLGAGETPLALRYGSVLLDLLTIALAAQMVRFHAGWDKAVLVALLMAFAPLLWAYAREIRAYAMVPLLTVILLGAAHRLLGRRERFPWRVFGVLLIAELLLLYTHNLSVPVVAWLNVVVFAVYGWRRAWRWLGVWIAGQVVLLIAYLPWLLGQSPSGTTINTPPRLEPGLLWDIWQGYYAPLPTMIESADVLASMSAIVAGLFVLSLVVMLMWRRTLFGMLVVSQAVLLPLLATGELVAANIDFHPRYYVAGVPAALMTIGLAVAQIRRQPVHALVISAVAAVGVGTGASGIDKLLHEPQFQHDDFRALAAHYATLPDDALIVIPYGWEPALDVYYADRLGIRGDILGIDLHSDVETAQAAINAALAERDGPVHVELLDWFQLPADLRGMYPCLLASAGEQIDEHIVQGLMTTGYRVERPITLTRLDVPPVTSQLVALDSASFGGDAALCVHTRWQTVQPSSEDLRASARLLTTDPPGWAVADSNSDIRNVAQEPTSALAIGERASAFSLLQLPAGVPPDEYALRLVVFSEEQPYGLDWRVDGIPAGQFVRLHALSLEGNTDVAFTEAPPQVVDVAVTEDVTLYGLDTGPEVLNAGQALRITLYWAVENCCREQAWTEGTLALEGDGWMVEQPVTAYGAHSLDWHALRVPADAAGDAILSLSTPGAAPVTLATYSVAETDRLFAPPSFEVPVETAFGDLAVLEGFSVGQQVITPTETLDLTLVWRVLATPDTSYRVFTHLLDDTDRVIAQHDGYPVNGERPTTGWVSGEYIIDPYRLEFDPEYAEYRGPARLEVGFYNPETGARIAIANGADHIVLPVEILVQ